MATGMIQWAIGKNVKVTITPQDVSSAGVFSNNALGSCSFSGRIEDVSDDVSLDVETFAPMDGYIQTPVPMGLSGNYRITEIDQALPLVTSVNKGYGYGNVLRVAGRASFYHKILLELYDNASSPVLIESQTVYVVMTAPRSGSRSRGKGTTSATFQLIDAFDTSTGARIANPAFA